MPPEKKDTAYLWDMLDAAKAISSFVRGRSFEDYAVDRMLRSAVERQVEIVGEAARYISNSFKLSHPEIPWQKIVGQRHVLAHEYGDIEDPLMWKVVTRYIPELIDALEPLVSPPPLDSDS